MKNGEPSAPQTNELREIAQQASVEFAILLVIEQSLRVALQWMAQGRGNSRKLSTLRFHVSAFERHLTRIQALADHGGYMHLVTDPNPHLTGEVRALEEERAMLRDSLERLVIRLDCISSDDFGGFEEICADLERFLDHLRTHNQKEAELLQCSFNQEVGGRG